MVTCMAIRLYQTSSFRKNPTSSSNAPSSEASAEDTSPKEEAAALNKLGCPRCAWDVPNDIYVDYCKVCGYHTYFDPLYFLNVPPRNSLHPLIPSPATKR